MAEQSSNELVSAFTDVRPTYEAFTENLSALIVSLLRAAGIPYLAIEKRTKTIESFAGKLDRPDKSGRYAQLTDMTDLSGIRIIVFYEEQAISVRTMLEENFSIDVINSVNKSLELDPDRFGYLSDHLVLAHSDARKSLAENQQFLDLKAEIQIRTAVQHAWAVLDRNLRYNNNEQIPKIIRRNLFRVSALLEVADKEFSNIVKEISSLKASYKESLAQGDLTFEINLESVQALAQSIDLYGRLSKAAESAGVPFKDLKDQELLDKSIVAVSKLLQFDNMQQLSDFIEKAISDAEENLRKFIGLREGMHAANFTFTRLLIMTLALNSDAKKAELINQRLKMSTFTKAAMQAFFAQEK